MAVTLAHTGGSGAGMSSPREEYVSGVGRTFFEHHFRVTFDSSYPAGGESIAASVGEASPWAVMRTVSRILCMPTIAPGGTGGYSAGDLMIGVPDLTNKKLLLYVNVVAGTSYVQVTDTTASQLITIDCIAWGYR